MPNIKEIVAIAGATVAVMFLANLAASQNATARRFLKGSSVSSAGGNSAVGTNT